ncbi:hypothetical protein [Pseudomonas aeruginosa]|uniref:hypothetical protein n=1 Tax=Pseudomonas aeruginosa TaxID=287 RepID=UPI003D9C3A2D
MSTVAGRRSRVQLQSARTKLLLSVGAAVLALLVGLGAAFGISLLIVRRCQAMGGGSPRRPRAGVDSERRARAVPMMTAMRSMIGSLRGVSQLQGGVEQLPALRGLSGVTTRTRLGIDSQADGNRAGGRGDEPDGALSMKWRTTPARSRGAAESADGKVSVGQEVVRQTLERIERLAECAVCARPPPAIVEALSADNQRIGSVWT